MEQRNMYLRAAIMIVIIFLYSALNPSVSWGAPVPAFNGRMNNAVSSIILSKVGKLGFAANDPRFGATITAVGTAATTVAAGVAGGAIASVGWPALLVGAGVSAVVSGAVSLGIDGLVNWLWGDNDHPQQVQLAGSGMGLGDPTQFPVIPSSYATILDTYGSGADLWFKNSTGSSARHIKTVFATCPGSGAFCGTGTAVSTAAMDYTFTAQYAGPFPGTNGYYSNVYRRTVSGGTTSTYQIVFDFIPASGVTLLPPAYTTTWKSAGEAVNDIPNAYGAQPVSDKMLADAVNTLWKKASSTNPQVIPWSASNPVTPADVAGWRAANPSMAPSVNDFISPVAAPGDSSVPLPITGQEVVTPSVPGTSTPPVSVDLGADPHTPAPSLEATPTAQQILSPVFNLMPDLKSFAVPQHSSTCPTGQFELYATVYKLDSHCGLIESNRSVIEAALLVCWTLASVFIVLRA